MTDKRLTLKEAAQSAVKNHNVQRFSKVVDQLRTMGFDYESAAAFFHKTTGISRDEFESLSYEADELIE
jgi:hypothetical protein